MTRMAPEAQAGATSLGPSKTRCNFSGVIWGTTARTSRGHRTGAASLPFDMYCIFIGAMRMVACGYRCSLQLPRSHTSDWGVSLVGAPRSASVTLGAWAAGASGQRPPDPTDASVRLSMWREHSLLRAAQPRRALCARCRRSSTTAVSNANPCAPARLRLSVAAAAGPHIGPCPRPGPGALPPEGEAAEGKAPPLQPFRSTRPPTEATSR